MFSIILWNSLTCQNKKDTLLDTVESSFKRSHLFEQCFRQFELKDVGVIEPSMHISSGNYFQMKDTLPPISPAEQNFVSKLSDFKMNM